MVKIIAIEGLRGTGKTTLVDQLDEKNFILKYSFPTERLKGIMKNMKPDFTKQFEVVSYHLNFLNDFMQFKRETNSKSFTDTVYVLDRYILSHLAHFRYDLDKAGAAFLWPGIASMLYTMFNNYLVHKPDLIIYLQGEHKQSEEKFDDHLYKGKETELEWYYNAELSNLRNVMGIPIQIVTSQKDWTFDAVNTILKLHI
jgi:thymidylate kinase